MYTVKWFFKNFEEVLGSVCGLILLASIFIGVIFRYVINEPLSWTNEVATIAFVWGVFLGISAAVKHKLHPVIDVLKTFLSPKKGILISVIVNVILAFFMIYFIYISWQYAWHAYDKLTAVLQWSYMYVYAAIPISFVISLFHLFQIIIDDLLILQNKEPQFYKETHEESGRAI